MHLMLSQEHVLHLTTFKHAHA